MTRMVGIPFDNLEEALSPERFGRYLDWAGRDRGKAIEKAESNQRSQGMSWTPVGVHEQGRQGATNVTRSPLVA